MSESKNSTEIQREILRESQGKSGGKKFKAFVRLSGPGWMQSAITLGGGSLAGSLYLGIIGGYEMMWLQPLMMLFGVVMLCAISHVALSTGERPFSALNKHVSPVLGWAWLIATLMANLVWAMPQFSLGSAALRQNLGIFSFDGGEYVAAIVLFAVSAFVVWLNDSSDKGYKIFDLLLKVMVGLVVLSFFAVVFLMATGEGGGLPWEKIWSGFIPNPGLIFEPAESLRSLIAESSAPDYWREIVVSAQRDRMVAAAATAVGINMTFLLPYSMMKRGWDRDFRGLAKFDLATGLFIPFVIATSCVVITAATQFHANPEAGLIEGNPDLPPKLVQSYEGNLNAMLEKTGAGSIAIKDLPKADRVLAATLIKRDAFALADTLKNLGGTGTAQIIFGIGVVGMAVSSIIILMLINGFAVSEMLGQPANGAAYRIGTLLPAITGAVGALYLWSGEAQFYLAVPTSRFGMVLLPIAYIAFFCLMNSRKLLGDSLPKGGSRTVWNVLMGIAILLALTGAAISILNDKSQIPGTSISVRNIALSLVGILIATGFIIQVSQKKKRPL